MRIKELEPRIIDQPLAQGLGAWLAFLCLTLLGYAVLGKGWAYLGIPPLYIGEVVLLFGIASFVLYLRWSDLLLLPPVWCLLTLMAWGLCRTLPDISSYGVDSLRDGVIWGYGAFALIVCATILAQPQRLIALLRRYKQFCVIFPVCVPIVWAICRFSGDSLPNWPGTNKPVIDAKGGDLLVHLAGVFAFGVCGFSGRASFFRTALMAMCVAVVGTWDRAGLFSFMVAFAICFLHSPRDRSIWRLTSLAVCAVVLLAVTNIHIQVPGRDREISFDQLISNVQSIGGSSTAADLDDTKEWRLSWWKDIFGYTFNGKYFWTGKGFGISLADDDGYIETLTEPTLRSPHSAHMTMLARSGVPGFFLWILVQMSWAYCILAAYVRSRRRREHCWPELFLFLFVYWTVFMINSGFDVVLEGPQGGIWFWTIYGVGLAAIWLYKYRPTSIHWDNLMDLNGPDSAATLIAK